MGDVRSSWSILRKSVPTTTLQAVYDVLSQLKTACGYMLMWFDQNYMQANAEKFQLILFARQEVAGSLNIGGTVINSEPVVKLPGFSIDKAFVF